MQFRFTTVLLLGLTVVIVSGCACGDRCRVPLLQRIGGRLIGKTISTCNCSLFACSTNCGCDSQTGAKNPWCRGRTSEPKPVVDVPKPPIPDLKSGKDQEKLSELKRADPPNDNQGSGNYTQPIVQPNRSTVATPIVVDEFGSPITKATDKDNDVQPQQRENTRYEGLSQTPPGVDPSVSHTPVKTAQNEIVPAETQPVAVDQNHADEPDVSVVNQATKKIKEVLNSTSKKTSAPRVHEQSTPVFPVNEIKEETSEGHLETVLVKSDGMTVPAPVVLRAVPNENHVVIDHRVSDTGGVGGPGSPISEAVSFADLPELEQDGASDEVVDFSDADTPNQEPPANSTIPNIEPVPQFQGLPPMDTDTESFTTPTSHQGPMENDASVLLEVASAIDCGVVDLDWDRTPKQHQLNSGSGFTSFTQQSVFRVIKPQPPIKQFRILRMRAATSPDRTAQVPPIVSIRSIMETVIVRNVHPEAFLPNANRETTIAEIQASPSLDEKRLDASIQGLSSRPQEDTAEPKTIDR